MSPLNSPGSQPPALNQEQPPAYPSQVGVNIFYWCHHATLIQESSWISDLHIRHVIILHSMRILLLHTSHTTHITQHCILLRKKDSNILIVWSCPSSSLKQHFAGAIYPVNVTWLKLNLLQSWNSGKQSGVKNISKNHIGSTKAVICLVRNQAVYWSQEDTS